MTGKINVKIVFLTALLAILAAMFLSCEALPFGNSSSQSWHISDSGKAKLAVALLGVHVDRAGGWDSIEREALSLAPLYFWEQGYRVVNTGEQPEFVAKIQIRERDFNLGWRSKKSLSIEVSIWLYEEQASSTVPLTIATTTIEQKLPMAVGRITSTSDQSFSSSQTLGRMLSKAIREAVRKLSAGRR